MADLNNDIAEAFGEATDSDVEVQVTNPMDTGTLEIVGSENFTENTEEQPVEQDFTEQPQEENERSLTDENQPQEENEGYQENQDDYYEDDDQQGDGDEDNYQPSTLDVLNEKYGTDYDDLDELLDDVESSRESDYASDQVAQLDRFVRETGRNADDFFRTQTQDYDQMSDEQVIKEYLQVENPDLSKKELDLFYDSTYRQNEEKYNNDDIELGKVHLKRDVSKARQELVDLQDEYWAPERDEEGYSEKDIVEMEAQEQVEVDKYKEELYDAMDDEIDDIESLTFEVNDRGETFEYKLTEEDKEMVGEQLSNLDDFFGPYISEDGQWDTESLALDMIAMKLQSKIVRSVANQYRSQGTEQVLRDIKNPSFEPAKVSQEKTGDSFISKLSKEIFGD
tara:strand:+ start:3063 stop:4247 length:1185 start_codon:yes stop_codon:yes gene_type:complete